MIGSMARTYELLRHRGTGGAGARLIVSLALAGATPARVLGVSAGRVRHGAVPGLG